MCPPCSSRLDLACSTSLTMTFIAGIIVAIHANWQKWSVLFIPKHTYPGCFESLKSAFIVIYCSSVCAEWLAVLKCMTSCLRINFFYFLFESGMLVSLVITRTITSTLVKMWRCIGGCYLLEFPPLCLFTDFSLSKRCHGSSASHTTISAVPWLKLGTLCAPLYIIHLNVSLLMSSFFFCSHSLSHKAKKTKKHQ